MNPPIARTFTLLFLAVTVPANADTWEQRFPTGTPPAARNWHTGVWTGSEMIVWGGNGAGGQLNTGGRYDPGTNSLTAVTTTGAPTARWSHTAVWTGSEMIVWGGEVSGGTVVNTGGRYDPVANSWTAVSTAGAPAGRYDHTAVWTGTEMIVWGGGAGFDVALNSGGRYNPASNSWTAVSTTGAPSARIRPTAVWTGSEMIVWGGYYDNGSVQLNDGGRYNPAGNSWTSVTAIGAPAARCCHTAVWTGSEMIVWGGSAGGGYLNTGGRYHPTEDSWTAVTTTGAPAARINLTAVWTGSEMIVWGGGGGGNGNYFNNGGRYNPAENNWTAMTTTGAPSARFAHTAVWTGSQMIVWGGGFRNGVNLSYFNDTFSYTPDGEAFRITSAVLEGSNLLVSFPSVTGRNYTLWQSGSLTSGTWTNTGLPAITGTGAVLTFTVSATTPGRRFFRVQSGL